MRPIMRHLMAATLFTVGTAYADEITDTIKEALAAYEKGDTSQAKEDLTYALELIKQKKGDTLKNFLPEPLSGWQADAPVVENMGAAMMGGGTTLRRVYTKGEGRITIEMVADSPLVQSIGAILSNPMFAAGRFKRIHRQKAMIEYDAQNRSGKVTMMINNRIAIGVTGEKVSEADMIAYAEAIDIDGLKKL